MVWWVVSIATYLFGVGMVIGMLRMVGVMCRIVFERVLLLIRSICLTSMVWMRSVFRLLARL